MEARDAAVAACDAWVGVGDTPFQLSVGPWFLEHLRGELDLCRRHGKRMFFAGVGVSEPAALRDVRGTAVLEYATRVWARDALSAQWLSRVCDPAKVGTGADLAHVYLRSLPPFEAPEPGVAGYVLNFESKSQFNRDALCALVEDAAARWPRQRWLAQEVRSLEGSEMQLWAALPEPCRARLELRVPDYGRGALGDLLSPWGVPSHLLSSRYHGALIGAWMGARVVAFERSAKVSGLVAELGVIGLPALLDAPRIHAAMDAAAPIQPEKLQALAARAAAGCADLVSSV
jgi:polysaccharide pyruvyl transferase WcaK-like protein